MKYFINTILALIITTGTGLAQENDYAVAIDTTLEGQNKWAPTGIRIGADILSPVLTSIDETRSSSEFIVDMDLNNFYLVGEFGLGKAQEAEGNTAYNSNGNYFRVGADANFIAKDKSLHYFALGLRYARSSYSESLIGTYNDPEWGMINKDLSQGPLSASWVEIASSLKVRIWRQFFTGYTLRFKFAKTAAEPENFQTYFIPGYGIAERGNNWSFHYYIFYRITWKKKPIFWKP